MEILGALQAHRSDFSSASYSDRPVKISTKFLPKFLWKINFFLLKFPVCKHVTADSKIPERLQLMHRGYIAVSSQSSY